MVKEEKEKLVMPEKETKEEPKLETETTVIEDSLLSEVEDNA